MDQSRAQQPVANIGLTFTLAKAQPNTRLTKARVWLNKKGSAWRPRFDCQRLEYVQAQENKLVPPLIKILISLRDNPWHQKRVRLIFRGFLASPWPWREKLCFLVSFSSTSFSFFFSIFFFLSFSFFFFLRRLTGQLKKQMPDRLKKKKLWGRKSSRNILARKATFFANPWWWWKWKRTKELDGNLSERLLTSACVCRRETESVRKCLGAREYRENSNVRVCERVQIQCVCWKERQGRVRIHVCGSVKERGRRR